MSYVDMSGEDGRIYVNSAVNSGLEDASTGSYLSAGCDYVATNQGSSPVAMMSEPSYTVSTVAVDIDRLRVRRDMTSDEIAENYGCT